MTCIQDKEVNKIAECNIIYDMINPPKRAKNMNSNYSPILHGFMNTRHGREKFRKFRIILDSGYSSKIVMGRLVKTLHHEKDAVIQWHKQAINITKAKVYFTLPALSATNNVL